MTLVKTSQGGFNLDNVIRWRVTEDGSLLIMFIATDVEVDHSHINLSGHEADRAIEILESVVLFDTTTPKQRA